MTLHDCQAGALMHLLLQLQGQTSLRLEASLLSLMRRSAQDRPMHLKAPAEQPYPRPRFLLSRLSQGISKGSLSLPLSPKLSLSLQGCLSPWLSKGYLSESKKAPFFRVSKGSLKALFKVLLRSLKLSFARWPDSVLKCIRDYMYAWAKPGTKPNGEILLFTLVLWPRAKFLTIMTNCYKLLL